MPNDKWREECEELRHQLKIETNKRIKAENEIGKRMSEHDEEIQEYIEMFAPIIFDCMIRGNISRQDKKIKTAIRFLEGTEWWDRATEALHFRDDNEKGFAF